MVLAHLLGTSRTHTRIKSRHFVIFLKAFLRIVSSALTHRMADAAGWYYHHFVDGTLGP